MRAVLLSSGSILTESETRACRSNRWTSDAVELELSFRVRDIADGGLGEEARYSTSSTAISRPPAFSLAAAARCAAGPPLRTVAGGRGDEEPHRPTPLKLLDAVPLFSSLTEDEKETLAALDDTANLKRRISPPSSSRRRYRRIADDRAQRRLSSRPAGRPQGNRNRAGWRRAIISVKADC